MLDARAGDGTVWWGHQQLGCSTHRQNADRRCSTHGAIKLWPDGTEHQWQASTHRVNDDNLLDPCVLLTDADVLLRLHRHRVEPKVPAHIDPVSRQLRTPSRRKRRCSGWVSKHRARSVVLAQESGVCVRALFASTPTHLNTHADEHVLRRVLAPFNTHCWRRHPLLFGGALEVPVPLANDARLCTAGGDAQRGGDDDT
jgi:hypothetical protein